MTHGDFCKRVEEVSGGRIKMNFHPGGALLKSAEIRQGVQDAIADMGLHAASEQPGEADLGGYVRLPLIGYKSWAQAEAIYREVFYKYPELQAEYSNDGLYTYAMRIMPPQEIQTTDKPVRLPADLKGMKIFATKEIAELVTLAGGAPVRTLRYPA